MSSPPPPSECGTPSWQEGVGRANAIMFTLAFPVMLFTWFYFTRRGNLFLCKIKQNGLWLMAAFLESIIVAAMLGTWAASIPCFGGNCYTEGCWGYTTASIVWLVTFCVTPLVYLPLRWFNLIGGVVDRYRMVRDGRAAAEPYYEDGEEEYQSRRFPESVDGMFSGIGWRSVRAYIVP